MPTPYVYPIRAIHSDGRVHLFMSWESLVSATVSLRPIVTQRWVGNLRPSDLYGDTWAAQPGWILRDDHNTAVDLASLKATFFVFAKRNWYTSPRHKAILRAIALGLPIPGTGHNSCTFGNTLRRMKTFQEIRGTAAIAADCSEYHSLASRVILHARTGLPTAYDDVQRHTERSWKRHRRTRYKVKKPVSFSLQTR